MKIFPNIRFPTNDNRNRNRAQRFESTEDRAIPSSVLDLLHRTQFLYRLWWVAHYSIGLGGMIAGAFLTAITSGPSANGVKAHIVIFSLDLTQYSWLVGIIAAVATSVVTFLGPLHKAERYWSAYHVLEQACLEYRSKEHDAKWDKLMKRVTQVRKILQVVDMDGQLEGLTAMPKVHGPALASTPASAAP